MVGFHGVIAREIDTSESENTCHICHGEGECLHLGDFPRFEDDNGHTIRSFVDARAIACSLVITLGPGFDQMAEDNQELRFLDEVCGNDKSLLLPENYVMSGISKQDSSIMVVEQLLDSPP